MELRNLNELISNPWKLFLYFSHRGLTDWIPDRPFLKLLYRARMGEKLNLESPRTFNEKLQWLKLYDRNPKYTTIVDKYLVREYIAEKIGGEYLIPLLGVWDDPEQIDYDKLPDQFVLKCNHDSGTVVICRDKSGFDREAANKTLERSLKSNYYCGNREWPYKNVVPKIICEKYMEDDSGEGLTDYKFFCFDGKADCVMVCLDRFTGDTKFYFFNEDWELLRLNNRGKNAPEGFTVPKPACMDEMFEIARKLSVGHPFVRVDLYECKGKVYFGELTFFPQSGFDPNLLPETDLYFGNLIELKKTAE